MAINIGNIISSLGQLSEVQQAQTHEIAQRQVQQGAIGQTIAQNLFEVSESTERIELQRLEAELKAQNASRRVARAAGMDATAANEIISSAMAQMRTDNAAYNLAAQQAQEMDANGNLLANPVGWLNNVLNGPQVRAQRDGAAERVANNQAFLNNMHSLTQSNVQTQLAIAETQTAATIKDVARSNALLAENEALKAEQVAMQYDIAGIETLREYGSVEFNRRLQVTNMAMQQQQHSERQATAKRQLEQQERQLERELGKEAAAQRLVDTMNNYNEAVGSGVRYDVHDFSLHWGQNTPAGLAMMETAQRAQRTEVTGSVSLGTGPYDTYRYVRDAGLNLPASLDAGAVSAFESAGAVLAEEVAEASRFATEASKTAGGLTLSNFNDPDAQARVFDAAYSAELARQDSQFENYELQTQFINTEYPEVAQTPYYQTVVEPLEQAGATLDIKTVAAQTAEAYATGKLNINEAADGISQHWRAQLDLFNATNGRGAVGAPALIESAPKLLVGERLSAPNTTTTGGAWGDIRNLFPNRDLKSNELYERVDLTDPTAVRHWLNTYRSNRIAREMQNAAQSE